MFKTLTLLALAAGLVVAQPRELQFDVATIRPVATINPQDALTGKISVGQVVKGNRVTFNYMSIRDLAVAAWEVKPFDVKAPDWAGQQHFDITAVMPEGATEKEIPQMLRGLLRDRFKMVAHKDSKESDVYALLEAKGGNKMKPAPELVPPPPPVDPNVPEADPAKGGGPGMTINGQKMDIKQTGGGGTNVNISGGKNGAQKVTAGPDGTMHMEIERLSMSELADQLGLLMDLPVQDRTGLKGSFTVILDLTIADIQGMMAKMNAMSGGTMLPPEAQARLAQMAAQDPGGTLLTSLSKLGLRTEKQKGAVATLIIDSAEKTPTEN